MDKRDALVMIAATSIVRKIRPECMNAAETICSIIEALGSREHEIENLQKDIREAEALLTIAIVPDGHDRCKMALKALRRSIVFEQKAAEK